MRRNSTARFFVPLEMLEKTRTGPQTKDRTLSADVVKSSISTLPISSLLSATDSKAPAAHCPCLLKH